MTSPCVVTASLYPSVYQPAALLLMRLATAFCRFVGYLPFLPANDSLNLGLEMQDPRLDFVQISRLLPSRSPSTHPSTWSPVDPSKSQTSIEGTSYKSNITISQPNHTIWRTPQPRRAHLTTAHPPYLALVQVHGALSELQASSCALHAITEPCAPRRRHGACGTWCQAHSVRSTTLPLKMPALIIRSGMPESSQLRLLP